MAFSWTNPNPQGGQTAGELGSAARVNDVNIGPVVAAILQARARKQALDAEQQQQLISGIAKGVAGFAQNAEQGQANDAANAAIYASQYGSVDPYGGFQDPNRVPDYGGTDALKALASARAMNPDAFQSPQDAALAAAKLDLTQAQAHKTWVGDYGSGGSDSVDLRRQQIMDAQDAKEARQALSEQLGVTGPKLDAAIAAIQNYKPGVNAFPEIGDNAAIPGSDQGSYKDAAIAAVKAYQDKVNAIRARSVRTQAGDYLPSDQKPTSTSGIKLDDVRQAAQRMAQEDQNNIPYGKEIPQDIPDTTLNPPDTSSTPRNSPMGYQPPGELPSPPVPQSSPGELEKAVAAAKKAIQDAKTAPAGAKPGATPSAQPTPPAAQITSKDQYDKLPSGSTFIGPDGKTWVKP